MRRLAGAPMRPFPFAVAAVVVLAMPSRARADSQRIVPVDIVVACDEDDATRARVEGQLSDLPVDVRIVRAGSDGTTEGALRVSFETTDDASRRVTVLDSRSGKTQSRRIELPDGPAALSSQRESVALTSRRMVKGFLDARAQATALPTPESRPAIRESWHFGALASASGSVGIGASMHGLRGDLRGTATCGVVRVDLGLSGVYRAFDVDGHAWAVEGLGPVVGIGVEQPWGASRLYVGIGASYVVGTRIATGPQAAPDTSRSFVLPRLEVAYRRPVGSGIWLGVLLAAEAELPRMGYEVQTAHGLETLASSDVLEPSVGLQCSWDVPEAP